MLHSLGLPEQNKNSELKNKPLLHYAIFHNSAASALYLLQRGCKWEESDEDGKTAFHVCAYMGHVELLKVIRNETKLRRIKALNDKYIQLLGSNSFKRTDVKNG